MLAHYWLLWCWCWKPILVAVLMTPGDGAVSLSVSGHCWHWRHFPRPALQALARSAQDTQSGSGSLRDNMLPHELPTPGPRCQSDRILINFMRTNVSLIIVGNSRDGRDLWITDTEWFTMSVSSKVSQLESGMYPAAWDWRQAVPALIQW